MTAASGAVASVLTTLVPADNLPRTQGGETWLPWPKRNRLTRGLVVAADGVTLGVCNALAVEGDLTTTSREWLALHFFVWLANLPGVMS